MLGSLGLGAAAAQAFWFPSSVPALLLYYLLCYAMALLAAARLVLSALGRPWVGPWFFALTLLLLRPDAVNRGGALASGYDFYCEVLLLLSILFLVQDESRARARRLDVMNTVTTVVGSQEHSGMTLAAMQELCRLYGAKFAAFQVVEGEELVLKLHVGLPDWFSAKNARAPVGESAGMLLHGTSQASRVSVGSFAPEMRHDLKRMGMRSVILVPVLGKTAVLGNLSFGLAGRRWFTTAQLRFLTTMANQLGIAGENLRLFERVSQSQRQWLSTIDSIDDYILVHDAQPRVLRLNRALAQRLGRPLSELTGQPLAAVLPNAMLGCPYCRLADGTSDEAPDPCFGGYSLVSTSDYVEGQAGRAGTVHIVCDRTEQRASEERYRELFESVQEGVFVSTPQGGLVDCNPAFASMLGYQGRDEMLGIDIGQELFLNAEQRAAYSEAMEKQGALRDYEVALRRKDGGIVTLLENSFATRDANGRIERYQGFLLDITEKKRADEEMRRRNRELGALNAMATIAARTFDLDEILRNTLQRTIELFAQNCDIALFDLESGQLLRSVSSRQGEEWERAGLRGLMEEEFTRYITQTHSEIITEQELPRLPQQAQCWLATRGYESFIAVVMYSQRKNLGILFLGSPDKDQFTETDRNLATAIARQLGNSVEKVLLYEETARAYDNLRNTQEQLLQSEKMSAVGQLISGVAHELNNPLTAILGYAQLLEAEPIGERALDFVNKLYRQTQRTHRVVQNLLSFSRQRKPMQSQVDLQRVLEDTLALREFDLKLNNIQLERNYEAAVPFITGDAHQLEQVFLNIINNAVDAIMDSGQGGSLKVRIYPEGSRVCAELRDSGPGLKYASKIFDPFYTTKKIGKGSGLGLSICYGIVKEHGGDILAFNHEQGGAVFQLKLPIAGAPKPSASPEAVRPAAGREPGPRTP
jgi:two-component system NtrC family sensor kinase